MSIQQVNSMAFNLPCFRVLPPQGPPRPTPRRERAGNARLDRPFFT